MRPLMVLALATLVLGGLQAFMAWQRADPKGAAAAQVITAPGEFSVELTLTFAAGPDPFSVESADDAPSVLLQLGGQELLRMTGQVGGDTPLVIGPVEGIVEGRNEFWVQVSPADSISPIPCAVRVRVQRDGLPLAEDTLWSEPGGIIQGTLTIDVPIQNEGGSAATSID